MLRATLKTFPYTQKTNVQVMRENFLWFIG